MEKRKRTYPVAVNQNRLLCGVLLALAAIVFLTGAISKKNTSDFQLEQAVEQNEILLNEMFDETPAEALIELPEHNWFALQTGVFENEDSARQSALGFQKRGAAGYLWKDGRFRVLAAVYSTQEDARYVRQQLQDQHQIDSYLYNISFPAVSLRVKGMQGQLDILQAAFVHVHELAAQLQQISLAMDRQECSVPESIAKLQALQEQLDIVTLRIHQRFASPMPETVKALLFCFEDYAAFTDELTDDESAASCGMKLKHQTFATLWNIQKMYQTLNHT